MAEAERGRPGRAGRAATAAFLAALVVSGAGGLDAWPFTDWRLFAGLRRATETGWVATAADGRGVERAVPFSALPRHYAGALQLMQGFGRLDDDGRRELCDAWIQAVEEHHASAVAEIRLYRTTVETRSGNVIRRSLEHTCGRS
ncbi:MAG TPA: hypothetical protein VF230_16995 [Acidimicrobiales bacterium]